MSKTPIAAPLTSFECIEGGLDAGVLLLCDHADNAIPAHYGDLGLSREALQRHIAYDIGAAMLTRGLALALRAPAVLARFSRLLIDPNRGADDPTLVMRISDGAIIPGNARVDAAEIERRRALYWAPYRDRADAMAQAMLAKGPAPVVISIHSFTPSWRDRLRPWKVGVLWDRDARLPGPLLEALRRDFGHEAVGDNEPYDGALAGDVIDAIATPRGLANALIEVRQDGLADARGAADWAARLAGLLRPILSAAQFPPCLELGSRAAYKVHRREQRG